MLGRRLVVVAEAGRAGAIVTTPTTATNATRTMQDAEAPRVRTR